MGDNATRPDARASATTRFDLRPGSVSRSDDIRLRREPPPRSSWSSRPSYGAEARTDGVRFAGGEVERFMATGLACQAAAASASVYQTTVGACATVVPYTARVSADGGRIGWTIAFKS